MAGNNDSMDRIRYGLGEIGSRIKNLRKLFDDRFDQQTELIKSSFRALSLEIQSLKKKS